MLTDTNAFAVTWNPEDLVPTMNDDSTFSVTLNAEQSSALQNAYFVIAKKDQEKDGMYDLVALSSAISNDGTGKLTADFDGQITYMQNDTTKENYELMYTVQEKTDTYTRYLISSILYNDDIEGDESMYAYFVLEVSNEHPEGQILGAYPIDNYINTEGNEIFPERYEIDINDYQNVAFGYFSHRFTSNEDLTNFNDADWADLTINYSSFPISELHADTGCIACRRRILWYVHLRRYAGKQTLLKSGTDSVNNSLQKMRQLNAGAFFHIHSGCHCRQSPDRIYLSTGRYQTSLHAHRNVAVQTYIHCLLKNDVQPKM